MKRVPVQMTVAVGENPVAVAVAVAAGGVLGSRQK